MSMRKPIIIGNWKMNGSMAFAKEFVSELNTLVTSKACDIAICPPATLLNTLAEALKNTNIALGAQNVHFEEKGAFTGEISTGMLKECGVKYVILGHSERRKYFADSNADICKKVKSTIAANLIPVLCVGESLKEREEGNTEIHLHTELQECLQGIQHPENIIIAYEPLWAIGTGKTATPQEANETIGFIRRELAKIFSEEIAQKIRILYGGSMNAQNAKSLLDMPEIDGGLIGGVSLIVKDFVSVINSNN